MRTALTLAAVLAAAPAAAADCQSHIAAAEARYGLPAGLLQAVVQTESGGNPYALNADGHAYYPADRAEAERTIAALRAAGAGNIDIGCGQISSKHHPLPLATTLDPAANIDYAARFLAELKERHSSWDRAVAHYHSSDPTRQAVYLAHVEARLTGSLPPAPRRVRRVGSLYVDLDAQRVPGILVRR